MNREKPKKIRSILKPATQAAIPGYADFPKDEPGVIYVRQSSIKQKENNIHSFEMQTDKFLEYFREQLGCTGYIEIIADDEGLSGTKDIHQRKGLSRIMKLIEGKELLDGQGLGWIGAVHVNRLTRDKWLVTPGTIMKECYENNVWIATLRMNFNFQDVYCQRVFMLEAEESARHLEWMKLILGGGKNTASSRGFYDGRWIVPGYIVDRSNEKEKKYTIYEPHAKIVKWLFRRFLELNGDFAQLCNEVDAMPFLFPAFESWVDSKSINRFVGNRGRHGSRILEGPYAGNYKTSASGLRGILCNPVYMGWWLPIGGGVVENNHDAIVDEVIFTYAHKRLSSYDLTGERQKPPRVRHSGEPQGQEGLLKNVIYDDRGKLMYTMKDVSNKSTFRYRSAEVDRVVLKYRFSVYAQEYDEVFFNKLCERIHALEKLEKWSDQQQKRQEAKAKEREETKNLIRKQIDRATRQRTEIMETMHDPDIPKTKQMKIDYANQAAGLEKKIHQWKLELEAPDNAEEDEELTLYQIHALLPDIKANWAKLTYQVRLRFINALVRKVVLIQVAPSWMQFEIHWKACIGNFIDTGYLKRTQANRTCWSEEEDTIIRERYLDTDGPELLKMLPYRTWEGITKRARALGIQRPHSRGGKRHSLPITMYYNNVTEEDRKFEKEKGLAPIVKEVQWFAK